MRQKPGLQERYVRPAGGGHEKRELQLKSRREGDYFSLLPSKTSEITIEEIAELCAIFGDGGEMQAERLS